LITLVAIVFRDTCRWRVLACTATVRALAAIVCVLQGRHAMDRAPLVFEATLAGFDKDRKYFAKTSSRLTHERHADAAARDLNARELRPLRKELLMVGANLGRNSFGPPPGLCRAVRHPSRFRFIVPGVAALPWRHEAGLSAALDASLRHYPLPGSLMSLGPAEPLRARIVAFAKPALKWGSVALAAWDTLAIFHTPPHNFLNFTIIAAPFLPIIDSSSRHRLRGARDVRAFSMQAPQTARPSISVEGKQVHDYQSSCR
jgi:hypothetical protein